VGNRCHVHECNGSSGKESPTGQVGQQDAVFGIAISPDGRTIASSGNDPWAEETTLLWDATSGKPLRALPTKADLLIFSPDGQSLITGHRGVSQRKGVSLWDVKTAKKRWEAKFGDGWASVAGAAFSADGRSVIWVRETMPEK